MRIRIAFTLDTYTEDIPELHHDAAETVSNLFLDDAPPDQAIIAELTDGTNESGQA